MEAIDQWITAHTHLTEAASTFFDACNTLRKAAAQTFAPNPNHVVLDSMLSDVQSRIESIAVVENCMHESRAVLNALLNVSTSRVPINKLPPELLSRIFSIAVASSPCTLKKIQRDALVHIPLVCVRWYQVATNNGPLWSHIDLRARSSSTLDKLYIERTAWRLQRSRGARIHLHLDEYSSKLPAATLSSLISILRPYVEKIASLELSRADRDLAQALLTLCFEHGGSMNFNHLLVSGLYVLGSQGGISWPTCPLPKLKSLELSNFPRSGGPNIADISTMLSSCPELHTLRLSSFLVHPSQQLSNNTLISLPSLKLFELSSLAGEALPSLLSALRPGDCELDLRLQNVSLVGGNAIAPELQTFLARSNVVSLTVDVAGDAAIQSLLSYLPRLRALILPSSHSSGYVLTALGSSISSTLLPNLRSLCLKQQEIYVGVFSQIKRVVLAKRLHNLVFLSCKFGESLNELSAANLDGNSEETGPGSELMVGVDEQNQDEVGDADMDQDINEDNIEVDEEFNFIPGDPEVCHKEMPERIMNWLSERVTNVVVSEETPAQVYHGIDLFVREMTQIS